MKPPNKNDLVEVDLESKEVQTAEAQEVKESDKTNMADFSPSEQAKMQKELQKQFHKFKRKFKLRSKSELVAIIWEQGMEFKKLQNIAQELYEENKVLKSSEETSNEE